MIWDDDDYYAMHCGLTDYEIFWAAWAEVWREMRIAYVWPRKITAPGHSTRILVRRWVKPVIRSWIVGVGPIPPTVLTSQLDNHLDMW